MIDARKRAEQQRVGRLAPGRFDVLPARIFEAGDVIDAAAADDAENGFVMSALSGIRAHSQASGIEVSAHHREP